MAASENLKALLKLWAENGKQHMMGKDQLQLYNGIDLIHREYTLLTRDHKGNGLVLINPPKKSSAVYSGQISGWLEGAGLPFTEVQLPDDLAKGEDAYINGNNLRQFALDFGYSVHSWKIRGMKKEQCTPGGVPVDHLSATWRVSMLTQGLPFVPPRNPEAAMFERLLEDAAPAIMRRRV
jgi:hypothetical protein